MTVAQLSNNVPTFRRNLLLLCYDSWSEVFELCIQSTTVRTRSL